MDRTTVPDTIGQSRTDTHPPIGGVLSGVRSPSERIATCRWCDAERPLAELVRVVDTRTGAIWHVCRPGMSPGGRPPGQCFNKGVGRGPRYRIEAAS